MQDPTPFIQATTPPVLSASNSIMNDRSGFEQNYQKTNPEKDEELNEFINKVGLKNGDDQTDITAKLSNTQLPSDDSNEGNNPIDPDSNEVVANDGTADPHSDRQKEDRGEDNPQDIDSTDEAVKKEIIDDESLDNDRLGDESIADGREDLDNMVNIDERGGSDGESGTDIERQSGEDPEDDKNDDEIVTSVGV